MTALHTIPPHFPQREWERTHAFAATGRNGSGDASETVTMPVAVYDAAAALIEEFLSGDFGERIKDFRGEAEDEDLSEEVREWFQQKADALEAAFILYEDWQIAHETAADAVADKNQQQLSF